MEEALNEICRLIDIKQNSYVVAVNVDVVMKMENDLYLKKISDEANLTIVDGKPLVWIAKLHKHPVKEKISGSDLVPELCNVSEKRGYSIFILGGAEGVAEKAKINLQEKYIDIKIVGTYSPPYGFEKDIVELKNINDKISMLEPDIVLACFGCPKQEKWVYENYKMINACVFICAGATVDFLAKNVKRAPRWMSNCGLEWLYRFLQEPRRLFKRYFIDDIRIFGLLLKYWK